MVVFKLLKLKINYIDIYEDYTTGLLASLNFDPTTSMKSSLINQWLVLKLVS